MLTAGIGLDPTFGQGGLLTTDIQGRSGDGATSLALIQPDGKILVAGNAAQPTAGDHFLLARYNADGSLDTSFGNSGFVTTTQGYNWNEYAMTLDASGHIVVAGDANTTVAGNEAIVARYNSDGTLDQSFGAGGIVANLFGGSLSFAHGVAIDPAGDIDVVGQVYHHTQTSNSFQLLLARLAPDGSFDTAFDNAASASVQTAFGTAVTDGNALAIDANGNIVVAGSYGNTNNPQALVARFTSAGALDTSFNGTGAALATFGGTAQANAVTVDSNQDVVIAGGATINGATYIAAARYSSAGTLDPTFGSAGEVTTYAGGYQAMAHGVVLDSSGRLVLAARGPNLSFAAYRYTASGVLDSSFGTAGRTIVNFGPNLTVSLASSVALTPAGQILLAGQTAGSDAVGDVALARLNTDGTLDTTFGPTANGAVLSSFQLSTSNDARAMAIQTDGKIVTVGSSWPDTGRVFSIERYNADGTLDSSFGAGGIALTNVNGISYPSFDNTANALAIDSLGRIVVAGAVDHLQGGTDIAVVRYEPDGSLDASFGTGGIVITSLNTYGYNKAYGVALDANGDILVAGATSPAQTASQSNFALLRYTTNGQLDTTFGGAALGGGPGWVQTDFSGGADIAYSMAVQPNGKIVLAGSATQSATGDDFALARYNADGSLDTTFGAGTGKVTTNFAPVANTASTDDAYGMTLDSQGRIILAGASNSSAGNGPFYGFAAARYLSDGTLDSSFGNGGKVLTKGYGNAYAGPVTVAPNGKILLGGEGDVGNENNNFLIARYNDNGTLDTTFTSTGLIDTDFGGGVYGWDQIYGMALDHEGRLVAAGASFHPTTSYDVGAARYVLDSTLAASAGGPYTMNEGQSLSLTAAAAGGDGGPLTYSWDVNGDGVFGDAVGSSPTLTWSQLEALSPPIDDGPATFSVSVRVSDSHGEFVVSAPVTLTVNDVAPTATLGNSGPVGEGSAVTVSFTNAFSPSPVDSGAGFHYSFALDPTSLATSYADAGAASTDSFAFDEHGTYTIYGRIFDSENASADYQTVVTVNDVAPSAALSNNGPINEAGAAVVSFTNPFSPSQSDTAAGFHYSFALSSEALANSYTAASSASSAQFTFAEDGPYTVYGRIYDAENAYTDYTTIVTVNEVAPTATLSNSGPISEGASATVSFTNPFSPSQADNNAGFHYSFALDPKALATSYAAAGAASTDSFTFNEDGTYTVYGRIFDADNASTDYTTIVTVNEAPPTATLSNNGPVNQATPVTVSFANAWSPSPADVSAGFRYSFALSSSALATSYALARADSTATFTFDDDGSYTVYGRVFDSDNAFTDYQTVVAVNDVAPTAMLSNNGPVNENSPAAVSFSNPFDSSTSDTEAGFHYSFATSPAGLVTSYAAAGTSTSAQFTFNDDGVYTIYGRIFDEDSGYTDYSTSLTVNALPPTAALSGAALSVRGQPQTYTFSASDLSPVDQALPFSYLVDWGDGSAQQNINGGASVASPHTYTTSGSYKIQVWATNDDGLQSSSPATLTVSVQAAAMEGATLVVGGTTSKDAIAIQPNDANGDLTVNVNGTNLGSFHPTGGLLVYAQAGDDTVQLKTANIHRTTTYVAVPAAIFGGDGNDYLDARGSSANDIVVGGSGNDTLYGGRGRNLLIGGAGGDKLYAGSSDDILIAGTTDYDGDLAALDAIMAEWGRTDLAYQQRINDLMGVASGGLNGSYLLNASTVHDDGASDTLNGGSGNDWFFYHPTAPNADVLKNKRSGEIATTI